jgi:hypothetical protein
VTQALLAVDLDLVRGRVRTAGLDQVAVHVLRRVLEAELLLQRRAAAHVAHAARQARGTTWNVEEFEYLYVRASAARVDRRRDTARA